MSCDPYRRFGHYALSGGSHPRAKPIYAVDASGNRHAFPSVSDGARFVHLTANAITAVLTGRRKTAGGFQWFYGDERDESYAGVLRGTGDVPDCGSDTNRGNSH